MSITCPKCKRWYEPGAEADPCLGMLPGVVGACCGHGKPGGYIAFQSGVVVRDFRISKDIGIYRPPFEPGVSP